MLALNATRMLENIMRFTSVAIAAALTLVTVSTALHGQKPDDQIDARSTQLLAKGEAAAKAGDLDSAADTLETALAIDPRNRAAFVALGHVNQQRGIPGKALRPYRETPKLDTQDHAALPREGEPMVRRGGGEQPKA